jgi:mannose-6-phosphate isomerase-like protein (cupin superfamily)
MRVSLSLEQPWLGTVPVAPVARPRYGAPMDEPVVLDPSGGEEIRKTLQIKVGRPEVVVTETRYEAGERGPDPHVHHHHVDAFWVLEGRLALPLGPRADEVEAGAGSFVLVPPDVVHSFYNPGPGGAHFLNVHAPGMGFDTYLRSGFQIPYDQHDPPADGGRPPDEVILRSPGEGDEVALGPFRTSIKAGGGDALGSLTVMEAVVGPGAPGPVLHRHTAMVDSFYVVDGVLTLHLGHRRVEAGPGSYAVVPPGNDHTFSNTGSEPVRMLNVMAPGGLERYLKQVAAVAANSDESPDPRLLARIASEYDFVAA